MKFAQVRSLIPEGKYTSVGSYPIFSVCRDGGVLCPACIAENRKQIEAAMLNGDDAQWEIAGTDANWEDPDLYCDNCNERIESAYAEPETEGA